MQDRILIEITGKEYYRIRNNKCKFDSTSLCNLFDEDKDECKFDKRPRINNYKREKCNFCGKGFLYSELVENIFYKAYEYGCSIEQEDVAEIRDGFILCHCGEFHSDKKCCERCHKEIRLNIIEREYGGVSYYYNTEETGCLTRTEPHCLDCYKKIVEEVRSKRIKYNLR